MVFLLHFSPDLITAGYKFSVASKKSICTKRFFDLSVSLSKPLTTKFLPVEIGQEFSKGIECMVFKNNKNETGKECGSLLSFL